MIGFGLRVRAVLGSVSPLSLILSAEPEPKAPLLCLLRQVIQDLLQLGTSDPKSLKELLDGDSSEASTAKFHWIDVCFLTNLHTPSCKPCILLPLPLEHSLHAVFP